jgi:hypothetical protein
LNHTPDGAIAKAARVAEEKKEASYFSLEREFYDFLPLAFDVFGGAAPKTEDFFKRLASMYGSDEAHWSFRGTTFLGEVHCSPE